MTDQSVKNPRDLRRQHNSEIVRRMRNGESLTSFDSKSSWYPPRPIIEKDKREMARLYPSQAEPEAPRKTGARKSEPSNVVRLDEVAPASSRSFDEAG